jgi:hypothetical protein
MDYARFGAYLTFQINSIGLHPMLLIATDYDHSGIFVFSNIKLKNIRNLLFVILITIEFQLEIPDFQFADKLSGWWGHHPGIRIKTKK